jgi:hypothetical protein
MQATDCEEILRRRTRKRTLVVQRTASRTRSGVQEMAVRKPKIPDIPLDAGHDDAGFLAAPAF